MMTLSREINCALLLLFVLGISLSAQKNATFSKKITFPISTDSLKFGTKFFNANDGGYWLMSNCAIYTDKRVITQILHFDSNWKITESKRTIIDNQRAFSTNAFTELSNGNKVFLITLDSVKYIKNNIRPNTLCIFDKNWKQIIFLEAKKKIFAPTAFSPNNDGFNDLFKVFLKADEGTAESYEIYDRWGNLIYQNAEPWNGKDVAQGVYTYKIQVKWNDGVVLTLSGDVTLTR